LLDSCSKSCMDQYPLIHLKWWLHLGQLLQWKYWVSVLLIQEMHFLCHHLTTRGNFRSVDTFLFMILILKWWTDFTLFLQLG
jgi:hypothetical protein